MSRSLWFVAGAGAGAYVVTRARRAAESLTAEGLRSRWQGLTHGVRLLGEDVRTAQAHREAELRDSLGLPAAARTDRQLSGPSSTQPPHGSSPRTSARPSLVPPMTDRKNEP